ncbi:MAG: hypothetical protein NEHIOOID_00492 [Holosporales bacterium]
MTLIPPKKILIKAAFMAMLCFCNMLTAANLAALQRRDSFKKLEDLRAKQKEDAGDRVLYEKRDGGFRPHDLMYDITEPGQSSRIMRTMANEQSNRRHQDAVQEGYVSYQDFMRMTDKQIQTVNAVVIRLSESYFMDSFQRDQRRDALNHQLGKNPNITVVLDCAGATRIDHHCLARIDMRKFKIIHAESVTNIGTKFLSDCSKLTMLDLRLLSNARDIGNFFLFGCSGLRTLDLTPLSNVTRIGSSFLSGCSGLRTLDLRPLSNARDIGDGFLYNCTGLRTLDFSSLSNVREIGYGCLSGCFGLIREDVTFPQNWRFENRLPEHLRQPRAVLPAQNARPVSENAQKMIDDLRGLNIDPKRPGSDYTSMEFSMASALMQGAGGTEDDSLQRLEEVFSTDRAVKIFEDITNTEDHSSDSDSDHSDR